MANLIVCLDGTWNNADSAAPQTNVAILSDLVDLRRTGNLAQQLYYDPGVGTGGGLLQRLAGGITGKGLSANILAAYRFLSLNYKPGDNIYLFGYSRGAFSVRSLSGFIAASGLLRAERCDQANLAFAWHYYRTKPKERFPADHARLRELSYADVRVRFRPFLLGPIFKAQGWTTSPFNLYPEKGRYMWRDLERLCADLDVPFRRPDPFPQNSLLAARVALVALDQGRPGLRVQVGAVDERVDVGAPRQQQAVEPVYVVDDPPMAAAFFYLRFPGIQS